MGVIRFAFKMLKVEKKQCKFYVSSMMFAIAIIFNVFNLLFNTDFVSRGDSNYLVFSALSVLVMGVAIMFVVFSNIYFIYGKTKELAIAVLSGRSVYSVGGILAIQNIILGAIGSIIGLGLGIIIMPIVNTFVYSNAGREIEYYTISSLGTGLMLIIILLLFTVMVLIDIGYVYRREIVELIDEKNKMTEKEKVGIGFHLLGSEDIGFSFKLPSYSYPILYLIPVIVALVPTDNATQKVGLMSYGMFASILGMLGVVSYVLPKILLYMKTKYFITNKKKLQSLSIVAYLLRKTNYLLLILIISTIYIAGIICKSNDFPDIRAVAIVVYSVVACIITITIIYKLFIEAVGLKNTFKQLNLLGYIKKDIKGIIREVVALFYIILFLIPLVPLISFIVTYIYGGFISWEICRILIYIYLGILICSLIISYIGFNKIIFSSLKEKFKVE